MGSVPTIKDPNSSIISSFISGVGYGSFNHLINASHQIRSWPQKAATVSFYEQKKE
jgi:hypothetical protein